MATIIYTISKQITIKLYAGQEIPAGLCESKNGMGVKVGGNLKGRGYIHTYTYVYIYI